MIEKLGVNKETRKIEAGFNEIDLAIKINEIIDYLNMGKKEINPYDLNAIAKEMRKPKKPKPTKPRIVRGSY